MLIHDAVRPFVTDRVIENVINAAKECGASGCAIDVTDTIVEVKDEEIKNIPDRKTLKKIQTPQGFRYSDIKKAHESAMAKGLLGMTDDCGLILSNGGRILFVEGEVNNIKVTCQSDVFLAERVINGQK